jgi:hypothetical protein
MEIYRVKIGTNTFEYERYDIDDLPIIYSHNLKLFGYVLLSMNNDVNTYLFNLNPYLPYIDDFSKNTINKIRRDIKLNDIIPD